jgi:gamma-glutamylcyclotransferase (GGCT)/AIG2-like uncharacterized protein YtfP
MDDEMVNTPCIPYFAYGANMNFSQMKVRCPEAQFLGRAFLREFQFSIYSDGYATIVPAADSIVWGGFWLINATHLKRLDKYEGVSQNCYYREIRDVHLEGSEEKTVMKEAWIYFATDESPGKARSRYLHGLIQGGIDCGLPQDYLSALEEWRQ